VEDFINIIILKLFLFLSLKEHVFIICSNKFKELISHEATLSENHCPYIEETIEKLCKNNLAFTISFKTFRLKEKKLIKGWSYR